MIKWTLRVFLFVLGALIGTQIGVRVLYRFKTPVTPPQFAPLLGSRLRLKYRDPVRALDFINLRKNETVLEIGAGTGVFTVEASKRVGPNGVVHAVDMQSKMIDRLVERLDQQHIANVKVHIAPAHRLPLANNSVDVAFMISTLPMISNRQAALNEIRRVLKPGGRLVVGEELPEPEYVRPKSVKKWTERAGFSMTGKDGNAFAYLLQFVKPLPIVDEAEEVASAA